MTTPDPLFTQDAIDSMIVGIERVNRTIREVWTPTVAQMYKAMNAWQQVIDGHPDPLVVHPDYPDPLPGWYLVHLYDPYALRMAMCTTVVQDDGDGTARTIISPTDSWHHPDHAYVREVARQFTHGERNAFWVDGAGQPHMFHAVREAHILRLDDTGTYSLVEVLTAPVLQAETTDTDDDGDET